MHALHVVNLSGGDVVHGGKAFAIKYARGRGLHTRLLCAVIGNRA